MARRRVLTRWVEPLLHVHDTPRRTALAFAVGVFFGFSPFLGLHTLLGLATAFLFRLNRVAVLLGVYSNLPWIVAPYYTAATLLGAALLGTELSARAAGELRAAVMDWPTGQPFAHLLVVLRPFFWPFVVGSTVGAGLLAVAAHWAAAALLAPRARALASDPGGRRG